MPTGFPSRFPVRNPSFIRERITSEGVPFVTGGSSVNFWSGRKGGGGTVFGAVGVGNAYRGQWIDSITITANVPCVVQTYGPYLVYQSASTPLGSSQVQSAQYTVGPAGLVIPVNSFWGADIAALQMALISVPTQDPAMQRSFVSNSGGTNLSVTKSATTDNLNSTYFYTLTASNSSGSTASGTTTITDTIPPDCDVVSTSGTGWTASVTGGVMTATSTTSQATGTSFAALTVTLRARTAVQLSYSTHGWQTDFDVFSDLAPIVWCGTSITAGTGSSYSASYPYLMRNWFRDTKGVLTRVVNKAISGSTSTHHEYLRAFNGRYTLNDAPFMVFWEHGINDISQNVTTATTQANLTKWLAYWNTFYPNTWCVVLSPWPTSNVTNEANLATLRTALASTMSTVGGAKNIWIPGTGTMFNPATQAATYIPDGIHLNDAGCALAATTIQAALTSIF